MNIEGDYFQGGKAGLYVYSSKVVWTEARKGKLTCGNGHKTNFSSPPEFQGEAGVITPEDAFVSSVNMSFMLSFLKFAEKEKIVLRAFECNCNGIMDRLVPRVMFKRLVLHPKVTVASDEDIPKVERCMDLADKQSVVSNSVKPKIVLEYKIEIDKKEKKPEKAA